MIRAKTTLGAIGTLDFRRDERAATAVLFALSLIPAGSILGAGIDLGRAYSAKAQLQGALDAAVIAGSVTPASTRATVAAGIFNAQAPRSATVSAPVFTLNADGTYSATVSAIVTNSILKIIHVDTTTVHASSKGAAVVYDKSCILSFGTGLASTADSMTFNGGSNLNLTGCTLQSDTSMVCNGNTTAADASLATGVASKCTNATSAAPKIPDIYASKASYMNRQCGTTSFNNIGWTSAAAPNSPKMITVVQSWGTEYHVCGSLTLSGSGTLNGTSTTADSIIVVENGDLIIADKADITAARTTFVITAGTTSSHQVTFPQGNGKAATLRVSPSSSNANPFQGISFFQDPSLTSNIDLSWGPGATLYVDGIMYFPNATLTMSGSGYSGASACTKLVVNVLKTNGSFALSQSDAGCSAIGLKQYVSPPHLLL